MNKLLIAATALIAFASCAKVQDNDSIAPAPVPAGDNVTVSFVREPNMTRAFFDATATTEA